MLTLVEDEAGVDADESLPVPALATTEPATVEASAAAMIPPAAFRADRGLVLV